VEIGVVMAFEAIFEQRGCQIIEKHAKSEVPASIDELRKTDFTVIICMNYIIYSNGKFREII